MKVTLTKRYKKPNGKYLEEGAVLDVTEGKLLELQKKGCVASSKVEKPAEEKPKESKFNDKIEK